MLCLVEDIGRDRFHVGLADGEGTVSIPSFLRCQPSRHRSHSESPRDAGTAGGLWWKRSHAREDEHGTGPCHVATPCYLVIANANPTHFVVVVVYRSRTTDLPGYRTPLQGASSFDVYPGLKPLGYSVRPLRGRKKTSKLQRPSGTLETPGSRLLGGSIARKSHPAPSG
jgi:hypothetical protein